MNDHKICFIICCNDDLFLSECCLYIQSLIVPADYEIDIITVKEADSMAAGYQGAMSQSDAKYKVYLHQDVFIINENFIKDMLRIFKKDSDIGMIGMVGTVQLPENATMWTNNKRCGALYANHILEEWESYYDIPIEGDYREVMAVDGLLMATCVDVPWRADLFQGWDFYDVSQSMEIQKAGYKVVVPFQKKPWCIHDDDILSASEYNHWRDVFLAHYQI